MKYVCIYYVCIIYPFFWLPYLFIGSTLLFFLYICQNGENSMQASIFFPPNRELYDLDTSHSLMETTDFLSFDLKLENQLSGRCFFSVNQKPEKHKELWPVEKLPFSVSINSKDKNILCYRPDPASQCCYQLLQERISVLGKKEKKKSAQICCHPLLLPSTQALASGMSTPKFHLLPFKRGPHQRRAFG